MKKKRIDLTLKEVRTIHDKYCEITCKGCPLRYKALTCFYYEGTSSAGDRWLNRHVEVPDESTT